MLSLRACQHFEDGLVFHRAYKAFGRTPAKTLICGLLKTANSLLTDAIVVGISGYADSSRRFDKMLSNWTTQTQVGHFWWTANTVIGIGTSRIILRFYKVR